MSRPQSLLSTLALFSFLAACSAGAAGGDIRRGDGAPAGDGANGGDGGAGGGGDGSTPGDDGSTGGGDGSTGGDGGAGGGDGGGPTGCGTAEICGNGLDDNCNGMADEGCGCSIGATQPCFVGNPAQAGHGACTLGTQTCASSGTEFGSWGGCLGSGAPRPLDCSMPGSDNDCDGAPDTGCGCTPGTTRACYDGPAGTADVGVCRSGSETCVMGAAGADWTPCSGEITPSMELCDGMDYDCDGVVNSGCGCVVGTTRSCYDGPAGTSGVGLCHDGVATCVALGGTASWAPCTGERVPAPDLCDGIDSACTGTPGATCVCVIGRTMACYDGPAGTRGVGACHDGTHTCVASPGGGSMWGSTCGGEALPGGSEICGNGIDDNCNGAVDEGCGGTLMCPGDVTVDAGTAVTLTALGTMIASWSWTIVSAPTGGASTAAWAPSPPTAASELFTPTIVGDYVIRVTGVDTAGRSLTCMFTVHAQSHGLRVELTWDGSGDLDLHMHNATASPWFSYATADDDCYYARLSTSWGAVLDFDNVVSNGPENIRVNTPAVGTDYNVAVHDYSAGAGRHATVKIFCGSTTTTTPTMTYTSRALTGTSSGQCSTNDFWKVARVRFTSATTCTITTVDTYNGSTTECSAF